MAPACWIATSGGRVPKVSARWIAELSSASASRLPALVVAVRSIDLRPSEFHFRDANGFSLEETHVGSQRDDHLGLHLGVGYDIETHPHRSSLCSQDVPVRTEGDVQFPMHRYQPGTATSGTSLPEPSSSQIG